MKRGYINIFFLIVLTFTSMYGMEGAWEEDVEAKEEDKSIVLTPELSQHLLDRELACMKIMQSNPEAPHEPSILDYLFGKNKCRFIWALMSNSKFRNSDAYPLMQNFMALGKKEVWKMSNELHDALEQGCQRLYDSANSKIKCLINKGVDLESGYKRRGEERGYRPLERAVFHQNLSAVQLILAEGVNPNIMDFREKKTPLWDALSMSITQWHIADLLLKYGLNINAQNIDGKTILHYCVGNYAGNFEKVKFLVKHSADVNIKDNNGDTPLHIVSAYSNMLVCGEALQIIDCLIESGADIFAENNKGQTPTDLAKKRSANPAIIAYLEDKAKNLEPKTQRRKDRRSCVIC